jgi:hypothetical protein
MKHMARTGGMSAFERLIEPQVHQFLYLVHEGVTVQAPYAFLLKTVVWRSSTTVRSRWAL